MRREFLDIWIYRNMAELFEARLQDDISPLKDLVAPGLEFPGLKYDPERDALIFDTKKDFECSLAEGGVVFRMSEVYGVVQRIEAARGSKLKRASGVLKVDLDCFIQGGKIPAGSKVEMIQMDRPFFITDGPFRGNTKDGNPLSHLSANSGAPGDFLMIKSGELTRVFRIAREWGLSAIEFNNNGGSNG